MARSASQPSEQPVDLAGPTELEAAQAAAQARLSQAFTSATAPPGQPHVDPLIDPGVQDNYRAERTRLGLTWGQLAERFDRMPDARLAQWARACGRHEAAQQRGATAAPAGRQAPMQDRA